MFWAPWVRSLRAATTLVALCGIPWAVSCWAPFAEMGIEINRMGSGTHGVVHSAAVPGYTAVRASIDEDDVEEFELQEGQRARRRVSDGVLRLHHPDGDDDATSTSELA
ncbi:MAG: hypothetical protein M1823_008418, partial [Watsoniomyces obsoletus]